MLIAQNHRTQERNRAEARERLIELIREAAVRPMPRRATKPTKAAKRKRLEAKRTAGQEAPRRKPQTEFQRYARRAAPVTLAIPDASLRGHDSLG